MEVRAAREYQNSTVIIRALLGKDPSGYWKKCGFTTDRYPLALQPRVRKALCLILRGERDLEHLEGVQ